MKFCDQFTSCDGWTCLYFKEDFTLSGPITLQALVDMEDAADVRLHGCVHKCWCQQCRPGSDHDELLLRDDVSQSWLASIEATFRAQCEFAPITMSMPSDLDVFSTSVPKRKLDVMRSRHVKQEAVLAAGPAEVPAAKKNRRDVCVSTCLPHRVPFNVGDAHAVQTHERESFSLDFLREVAPEATIDDAFPSCWAPPPVPLERVSPERGGVIGLLPVSLPPSPRPCRLGRVSPRRRRCPSPEQEGTTLRTAADFE